MPRASVVVLVEVGPGRQAPSEAAARVAVTTTLPTGVPLADTTLPMMTGRRISTTSRSRAAGAAVPIHGTGTFTMHWLAHGEPAAGTKLSVYARGASGTPGMIDSGALPSLPVIPSRMNRVEPRASPSVNVVCARTVAPETGDRSLPVTVTRNALSTACTGSVTAPRSVSVLVIENGSKTIEGSAVPASGVSSSVITRSRRLAGRITTKLPAALAVLGDVVPVVLTRMP